MSIESLKNKAQKIVNLFIRLRDAKIRNGKLYATCLTCGREWELITATDKRKYHSGHYFKEHQFSPVRYEHDNMRGQCSVCNKDQHGQMGIFKRNLILEIGQERFDILNYKRNQIKKWTALELEQVITEHKKLLAGPEMIEKLKIYSN